MSNHLIAMTFVRNNKFTDWNETYEVLGGSHKIAPRSFKLNELT